MNTRKIWFTAMLFGIIAAGLMYVMVVSDQNETVGQATTTEPEEGVEEQEVESTTAAEAATEPVEKFSNELLPITEGNRAITVAVTDNQGVAGFIDPGSFVDIVAIMQVPEEHAETQHDSATLLLQNVKVLAIGHAADDEETMKRYQMVTIEVTPKEGLSLGFATKHELYLLLREEGDDLLEPDHTHVHEDDLHEGVFR
ncbi:Flp pilus assembly protein CpaB [Oceanobacillus saliphilus]|uniref:Flp pilus assembly protein CpaB n=1 Tax=Oceanobacillus saliphilus TaxID=2925834 RepID=UPI00201D635E|nr:Flp pilus assembly protein CpaB [Oceanobacillus saliphilus]